MNEFGDQKVVNVRLHKLWLEDLGNEVTKKLRKRNLCEKSWREVIAVVRDATAFEGREKREWLEAISWILEK